MKIKIEMTNQNDLQEFQEFMYDHEPELVVDEVYDMTPGFNREPIAVAVIVALGGPAILYTVQGIIKEYLAYKVAKEKEVTKRIKEEEITKRTKTESEVDPQTFVKISINQGDKWIEVNYESLADIDF